MNLADAYPNSDISAGAMTVIAVVMVAVLVFWLVMVYVAAREPERKHTGEDEHKGTVQKV
jgi:heme/copper-type cytochrome/quinol oxidase subunit 2